MSVLKCTQAVGLPLKSCHVELVQFPRTDKALEALTLSVFQNFTSGSMNSKENTKRMTRKERKKGKLKIKKFYKMDNNTYLAQKKHGSKNVNT